MLWVVACGVFIARGSLDIRVSGDIDGLLPPEHRASPDAGYLLL